MVLNGSTLLQSISGFMQKTQAEWTSFTFNVALELKMHPRIQSARMIPPLIQSESPIVQSERITALTIQSENL